MHMLKIAFRAYKENIIYILCSVNICYKKIAISANEVLKILLIIDMLKVNNYSGESSIRLIFQ